MKPNKISIIYSQKFVFKISRLAFIFLISILHVLIIQGQAPRVGINTANPLAALHVADSSVLFSANTSINLLSNPPVQGPGTRLMWFSPRIAFRSGHVQSDRWDRDSIGLYSFAANYNNLASGQYSSAFGLNTSATGIASTTFGEHSKATGNTSLALGSYTTASGDVSLAMGHETVASGNVSVAMGYLSRAEGLYSLASGFQTIASGDHASAFGIQTLASGNNAAAFGSSVVANSFNMFALGYFNVITSHDLDSWVPSDPLFVVGNGSINQRKNALTLLKNGNLGLDTINPTFRLHVTNNNGEAGGMLEGIMIENTHAASGEAGLSFRNRSIPSTRQWTMGMNQNPRLSFCYGTDFTGPQTKMLLDTFGRLGINSTSPVAQLHVIRNGPSSGLFHSNAMAIFESNTTSYIQFSTENADETGILSGNQVSSIRSAIIFRADSSIQIRTGGNTTRMTVSKNGDVGIGTTTPAAKLDVNGTCKFGTNGSVISEIIKATVNADAGSVAANGGTTTLFVAVPNGGSLSAVSVSPGNTLPGGLVIASARAFNVNTVEIRFVNTTGAVIDPPAMDYHFVIVR